MKNNIKMGRIFKNSSVKSVVKGLNIMVLCKQGIDCLSECDHENWLANSKAKERSRVSSHWAKCAGV